MSVPVEQEPSLGAGLGWDDLLRFTCMRILGILGILEGKHSFEQTTNSIVN
jgi:hypothetical protein